MFDPAELWTEIEGGDPELAKTVYPRHYIAEGDYHSPKMLSVGMAMAVIGIKNGRMRQTGRAINGDPILVPDDVNVVHSYSVTIELLKFMVPTVFVGRDMLKAAMATRLPPDLKVRDIKWPFPAIKFVFPRASISSPHDGEIPGLAIGRTEPGINGYQNLPKLNADAPGIGLFTIAMGNGCPLFASHLDMRDETTHEWITRASNLDAMLFAPETKELFGQAIGKDHPEYALLKDKGGVTKTTDADKVFLDELNRLGLKLMLIMAARPNLVEKSTMIRKSSLKHGRQRTELWSPNYLGRQYQLQRSPGEKGMPTGRHVILHPVCGHTRMQPYGSRDNPTYRPIWIEPTWSGTRPKENAA